MSYATESIALIEHLARRSPLPAVRALHLPPPAPTDGLRGEFGALELDDGSIGLSYVLLGDTWAGLTQASGRLVRPGQDPLTLARGVLDRSDPLARTVGHAAINALTASLYRRAGFTLPTSRDSIGELDPRPGETIGMIGHFTPLIRRVTDAGARLVIVELRADLVGERDGVVVTLDPTALARCDKILSTGTLLLNDTLETMLAHGRAAQRFAMIGPSVGGPPDGLFARGVSLLGGTAVTDRTGFIEALLSGQSTSTTTRKTALTPADYPGWRALLDRV